VLLYFFAIVFIAGVADARLFLTFQQTLGSFMTVVFWASWALPERP
jgi:hypothetical protein